MLASTLPSLWGQRTAQVTCPLGIGNPTSAPTTGHSRDQELPAFPGKVFVRDSLDSAQTSFTLLTREASALPPTAPVAVSPPGMTPQRQWYLHDSIREFVGENQKDILCPRSDVPKPGTSTVAKPGTSATAPEQGTGRGKGKGTGSSGLTPPKRSR